MHPGGFALNTTPAPTTSQRATALPAPLALDDPPLAAVRVAPATALATPRPDPWQREFVNLLNDALATELVCVLRYKRHHFTAHGIASPRIAEEFMAHARKEMVHADRLAKRIVQLGGAPDFAPDSLAHRSHAAYDESRDLTAMIRANLVAERLAIETYTQMISLLGPRDPATRRLLEDILIDEQEHAEELSDWLRD
jgi:bacterioferritin